VNIRRCFVVAARSRSGTVRRKVGAALGALAAAIGTLVASASVADADSISTTSTYFIAHPDTRRCAPPSCGGIWVRRLNQPLTTCHDGVDRAECYVPSADFATITTSEDEVSYLNARLSQGALVVRGALADKNYSGVGNLGTLIATEAWDAATDEFPADDFYFAYDSGIRCTTAPCDSFHIANVNTTTSRNITDLDLQQVPNVSDEMIQDAMTELLAARIVVAGTIVTASPESKLIASQFYTRFGGPEPPDTFTYFDITRDLRDCDSPQCGGYYVKRLNLDRTQCANGKWASRCYVAELDTAALGLPEGNDLVEAIDEGKVIVRGEIARKVFSGVGNLGEFVASEVWVAGAGAGTATGVFVKVEQPGISCHDVPCVNKVESTLNSNRTAWIANLKFTPSGATREERERALDALPFDGLIVAGDRYTVKGPAGRAKGRTVNQFWIQMH